MNQNQIKNKAKSTDASQTPTRPRGKKREVIQLRDGSHAVVRSWNHLRGEWRLTQLGRQFYGQRQDRWLIHFPTRTHIQRKNSSYFVKDDWLPSSATDLGELSYAATTSEAAQRADVQRRAQEWLASIERQYEGQPVVFEGTSEDFMTYDPARVIQYSREDTQILPDGSSRVEAVLNRPLNHAMPWAFSTMYNAHSIAEESLNPIGNCVVHALAELTLKNGRPLWAREQLEAHLDDIQSALYAEPAEDPYWDEDSESSIGWRKVGVTARMVLELCRRHGIPVHVLWRNDLVESSCRRMCTST